MDGGEDNKRKTTLLSGLGSSIWNFLPKFISAPSIDLDRNDSNDDVVFDSIENRTRAVKDEYKNSLMNELKSERNKRVLERSEIINSNIKRPKLNNSVYETEKEKSFDSEFIKPAFSYKSMSNDLVGGHFSHIGSVNSITESLDESFLGATASRISNNLFSFKSTPVSASRSYNTTTRISTPYSMANRRYKTAIKRDKVSSYLVRETTTTNNATFEMPPVNVPLTFALTPNKEETLKRFDLSQLRQTPNEINRQQSVENWICDQCDTDNPMRFNFCPTCSNANPRNKVLVQPISAANVSIVDDHSWTCLRCTTVNNKIKSCCACCFLARDIRPLQYSNTKQDTADSTSNNQLMSENVTKVAFMTNIKSSQQKWECQSCMVDNDACVCCATHNPSHPQESQFGSRKTSIIGESLTKDQFGNLLKSRPAAPITFGVGKESSNNVAQNITFGTKLSLQNESLPFIKFGSNSETRQAMALKCGAIDTLLSKQNTDVSLCIPLVKSVNTTTPTLLSFGTKENDKKSLTISFGTASSTIKWECPSCMVENDSKSIKCVCCETKNPKIDQKVSNNVDSAKSQFQFGVFGENNPTETFKFGSNGAKETSETKKWECPSCMVENDSKSIKCVCCETKNPNLDQKISGTSTMLHFGNNADSAMAKFQFGVIGEKQPTESIKFGCNDTKEMSETKKWECPSCMVENDSKSIKCVCCDTKNPVAPGEKKSVPFTTNVAPFVNDSENKPKGGFVFGSVANNPTSTNTTKSLFMFGGSKTNMFGSNTAEISVSHFKFGVSNSNLSNGEVTLPFGAKKNTDLTAKENVEEPLNFMFSDPVVLPYASKVALAADIEFVFSDAGVV